MSQFKVLFGLVALFGLAGLASLASDCTGCNGNDPNYVCCTCQNCLGQWTRCTECGEGNIGYKCKWALGGPYPGCCHFTTRQHKYQRTSGSPDPCSCANPNGSCGPYVWDVVAVSWYQNKQCNTLWDDGPDECTTGTQLETLDQSIFRCDVPCPN